MEILDLPATESPDVEHLNLEELELDLIAFELWQRGSLPEVAAAPPAELEEVACHASCL